jgi:hypothetical protein
VLLIGGGTRARPDGFVVPAVPAVPVAHHWVIIGADGVALNGGARNLELVDPELDIHGDVIFSTRRVVRVNHSVRGLHGSEEVRRV